jgi:hypothetical protein
MARSLVITWKINWKDWAGIPSSTYNHLPGLARVRVLQWLMESVAARRDTLSEYHRSYRKGRLRTQLSKQPYAFKGKLLNLLQRTAPFPGMLERLELTPVPPVVPKLSIHSSLPPSTNIYIIYTKSPS